MPRLNQLGPQLPPENANKRQWLKLAIRSSLSVGSLHEHASVRMSVRWMWHGFYWMGGLVTMLTLPSRMFLGCAYVCGTGEFSWATVSAEAVDGTARAIARPTIAVTGPEPAASIARQKLEAVMARHGPDAATAAVTRMLGEMAAACATAEWNNRPLHASSEAGVAATVECGICYAPLGRPSTRNVSTDLAAASSPPAAAAALSSSASSSRLAAVESAGTSSAVHCPRCPTAFHARCVGDWLRGLPAARSAFSAVIGPCPYCGAELTVDAAPLTVATIPI